MNEGLNTTISMTDHISSTINAVCGRLANMERELKSCSIATETLGAENGWKIAEESANNFIKTNEKAIKSSQNFFSTVQGSLLSFGAVAGITKVFKDGVQYASDLEEVQNVVDVAFGEQSETINTWAKNTSKAFGISELQAKKFSGTLGAMLQSMGATESESVSMSKNLTQLAGDLASFYNLDTEEAFNKIRSGISGETEPLKQIGINMSVANLEAYAMSKGIDASYQSMDEASKSLLRYNYLLEQTQKQQGDFSRTSDSLANSSRVLSQTWEEFKGKLSEGLTPVLANICGFLNGILNAMKDSKPATEILSGAFMTLAGSITACSVASKLLGKSLSFSKTLAIVGAVVGAFKLLKIYMEKTGTTFADVVGVFNVGITAIGVFFRNLAADIGNVAMAIWGAMGTCAENMKIIFFNVVKSIQAFFYDFASVVMRVIGGIAEALSYLPFVELDYEGLYNTANEFMDEAQAKRESREETKSLNDAFNEGLNTFSRVSYEEAMVEAWDKAHDWFGTKADENKPEYDESTLDGIGFNTDEIADNTKKTIDISAENLRYLRDIAEQEVINRFTTAEIKIDMTNNNSISNTTDIDGLLINFNEGLNDAMARAIAI